MKNTNCILHLLIFTNMLRIKELNEMKKKGTIIFFALIIIIGVFTSLFYSFPNRENTGKESEEQDRAETFEDQLLVIAKDTYRFFEDFTNPDTGLTMDRVDVGDGDDVVEHTQTSPTNIGMYMMSTVSAVEFDLIDQDDAKEKMEVLINTLKTMDTWNGLYYNWYYTDDATQMTDWGQFISTVDNGWLTAGLIVIGQYFPELSSETDELVQNMDYSHLYDPNVGQMYGGYDAVEGSVTDHHYGMLYSETRVASYLSVGKGDVPEEHWWRLFRTFPPQDSWQSQQPEGYYETIDGIELYQGHYEYEGIKYVPSWGGSMFEALMPTLVLKENELGTTALGLNNERHVQGQIAFAEESGYSAWGFSPAALPDSYLEFGVPVLGAEGYQDHSTVTPHATFLAIEHAPEEVEMNLEVLYEWDIYGEYGFFDTVNMETGKIAQTHLALDQGMIIVSIANYLKDGVVREYFHSDPIGSNPEHLLTDETFSIH